jgi:hypothetical protein
MAGAAFAGAGVSSFPVAVLGRSAALPPGLGGSSGVTPFVIVEDVAAAFAGALPGTGVRPVLTVAAAGSSVPGCGESARFRPVDGKPTDPAAVTAVTVAEAVSTPGLAASP